MYSSARRYFRRGGTNRIAVMKNVLVIALPVFGDVLVCTPLFSPWRHE